LRSVSTEGKLGDLFARGARFVSNHVTVAIDRYKEQAERGAFQIKVDSYGYPPDLEALYNGVEAQGGKKIRFLRSIPTDPMTNGKEWGLRALDSSVRATQQRELRLGNS